MNEASILHRLGQAERELRRRDGWVPAASPSIAEALSAAELHEYETLTGDGVLTDLPAADLARVCEILRVAVERQGHAPLGVLAR